MISHPKGGVETPLKRVLTYLDERVQLDEMTEYITIIVKRRHGGLEAREKLFGHQIKTKKQFRLTPGAFIISRVQCWHQAFAIVPADLPDNMIASTNYDQFAISPEVDQRFFWWLSHSPFFAETVRSSASGVVIEKMVFDRDAWLEKTVPLPSLEEQQRIVARIEQLAAKIEEARRLRHQTTREADALVHSAMKELLANVDKKPSWKLGPIAAFAEINPTRAGNVSLSPGDLVSFVPMKAVDDVTGTIAWPEPRPYAEVAKGYTWFKDGDVIFARITPCMQNGKAAIARNLVNGVGFGSTEFHVIRPGPQITAEWMHGIVRHRAFRDDAAAYFKGTAGQQRVPQSFLEQKEIPVPSLPEQCEIIAYLNRLAVKMDELKRLQAETAAELDALLPAILDRAFKGKL